MTALDYPGIPQIWTPDFERRETVCPRCKKRKRGFFERQRDQFLNRMPVNACCCSSTPAPDCYTCQIGGVKCCFDLANCYLQVTSLKVVRAYNTLNTYSGCWDDHTVMTITTTWPSPLTLTFGGIVGGSLSFVSASSVLTTYVANGTLSGSATTLTQTQNTHPSIGINCGSPATIGVGWGSGGVSGCAISFAGTNYGTFAITSCSPWSLSATDVEVGLTDTLSGTATILNNSGCILSSGTCITNPMP